MVKNALGNVNRMSKDPKDHSFKVYAEPGCFKPMGTVTKGDNTKATKKQGKKIKPNDPCPCGSGKKYKKCCRGKGTALGTAIEQQLYCR